MAQTQRAKMHLRCVLILLVLTVVADSCDEETHYKKENKCCKMCEPGTRMMIHTSSCEYPVCQPCEDGEYQDAYTAESKCKLHKSCDPNLNLQTPVQSKTKYSPCLCKPNHHCASTECDSCVRNTVCKAGEKLSKTATQMEDAMCELCPNGTFSNQESALSCTPWTECLSGYKEAVQGSSTSDRICEVQKEKLAIVIPLVVILLFLLALGILCFGFHKYKKGKTGSISFVQKMQVCPFWAVQNTHKPTQDNMHIENEQPETHVNEPEEDTEEPKQKFIPDLNNPGISENGFPVIQDHSKSLLLSESETEPESLSEHF